MIYNFRLRNGFGITSIMLLICFIIAVIFFDGYWRIIPVVPGLLTAGFILIQYQKYNSAPWRKIHYPGYIIYAGVVGRATTTYKNFPQEFRIFMACRTLAALLLKKDIYGPSSIVYDKSIDDIMNELKENPGNYLVSLLQDYLREFGIDKDNEDKKEIVQKLSDALLANCQMGPTLIFTKVIEIIHGRKEAGRYIFALFNGDAE